MADNLNLAQILVGIAALTAEEDIKTVLAAVKEQKKKALAEKKKKQADDAGAAAVAALVEALEVK